MADVDSKVLEALHNLHRLAIDVDGAMGEGLRPGSSP